MPTIFTPSIPHGSCGFSFHSDFLFFADEHGFFLNGVPQCCAIVSKKKATRSATSRSCHAESGRVSMVL